MKKQNNYRYWFSVTILLLLALVLGTLSMGSALQIKALDWFGALSDVRPHEMTFVSIMTGVLTVLAAIAYVIGLNPYFTGRPLKLVYLNFFAPSLYLALGLAASDRAGANEEFGTISRFVAPLAAILPPMILLGLEALVYRILLSFGHKAQGHALRRTALLFLTACLRIRPGDKDTRRRCGMLYVDEEECAKGLGLLEPLDPIEVVTDEERLKAMEHCYRAQGRIREALLVLLRMQQLKPDQSWIDRRILDDYVRLELHREALDLLESGRLKMNLELLQLAEKLNVTLGNYAQAVAQIRQIAIDENRPYSLAIKLYRDLLAKLPDHVGVKINLGLLLLDNVIEDHRREGAALLEDVLTQEPHRLHLARHLTQYYTESNQPQAARKHLQGLVEAGDPDPEYHLAFVQILTEEEQHEAAAKVLQDIVTRWPDDWRGHWRLARVSLLLNRLDEADRELEATTTLAPEEAAPLLETIRNGLEQRRRKIMVKSMREDVARNVSDVEKRLELVEHQIGMEMIDEALAECDRLLDENPELLPTIIEIIERGMLKAPRSFRLRSYLSDIYYQQGRFDDTLRLYREMAEQSLNPARVLTDGCRMILDRAPGHLTARREMAMARRGEEDWAGVLEALDPPDPRRNAPARRRQGFMGRGGVPALAAGRGRTRRLGHR